MLDLLDGGAIYDKIDKMRRDKGWSIYGLAKKAGISTTALYHWRDRRSSPTLDVLDAVCSALNISVIAFLLEGDELITLTDAQQELVDEWNQLSTEQKRLIIHLMRSINRKAED